MGWIFVIRFHYKTAKLWFVSSLWVGVGVERVGVGAMECFDERI